MYLMYYLDASGNRVYTLAKVILIFLKIIILIMSYCYNELNIIKH